jgi:hypothetical protein
LGIRGLGVAVAGGARDTTTAAAPVGRRCVPALRLFFTVVAATLWAMAAANGAAWELGAGGCGGTTMLVLTGGRPERSIPAILGGGGVRDKGEREIGGGGGGGARAREGNELKCPSHQWAEGDIGWASVLHAELEIPGSGREFFVRH